MNQGSHISGVEILILVVCTANLVLLVALSFSRGRGRKEKRDSREKIGLVAVFFGLASQVFYLLMTPWAFEWVFFYRNSILHQFHVQFPAAGLAVSGAAFFTAWFDRGLRRYASLWVAVTTGFLWALAGLAFLFVPA